MRTAAAFLMVGGGLAFAQSSMLPTTAPTAGQTPKASGPAQIAAVRANHRAEIVYSGGLLQVTADNSSLNQILRDIARETGMKITGGVAEDRVYGKYGPAAATEVLANLLEGTGSNMILRETATQTPAELILTPRGGGPTPPNPNAARDEDNLPVLQTPEEQMAAPSQPVQPAQLPFSRPAPTLPAPSTGLPPQPAAAGMMGPGGTPAMEPGTTPTPNTQPTGTTDPAAGTTNPTSPNGAKTPQQIYQQLIQLRQQQQANPPQ